MGFGKDGTGVMIQEARSQALGTLAQDAGILIGTKLATLERFRMLKAQVDATIDSIAAGEAAGLSLYLADGDLSLTEIESKIEGNGPLGPNDRIQADQTERPVFLIGKPDANATSGEVTVRDMHTGAPVCIAKPRWTFARTKSWNWVVHNRGPALTTGATIRIVVTNFGVWVT